MDRKKESSKAGSIPRKQDVWKESYLAGWKVSLKGIISMENLKIRCLEGKEYVEWIARKKE